MASQASSADYDDTTSISDLTEYTEDPDTGSIRHRSPKRPDVKNNTKSAARAIPNYGLTHEILGETSL
jgi:hypothetical protein